TVNRTQPTRSRLKPPSLYETRGASKQTWVYDLGTNMHFTLKTKPLRAEDLADFVQAYSPDDRGRRVESERFRCFTYDELVARDRPNHDITWLRDESLDDAASLPAPACSPPRSSKSSKPPSASSPSWRLRCRWISERMTILRADPARDRVMQSPHHSAGTRT